MPCYNSSENYINLKERAMLVSWPHVGFLADGHLKMADGHLKAMLVSWQMVT